MPFHCHNKSTWITISTGLILTIITYHILPFQSLLPSLLTITHEIGHTITGWLLGYPSFPSFENEGGMTLHHPQNPALLLSIYLSFGIPLTLYRHHHLPLYPLLITLTTYSALVFTSLSKTLILIMGHGMELLLAGYLLYLALTNFSQWLCPWLAMLGFSTLLYDFSFAYKLRYDSTYQMIYTYQQGGKNLGDFSQLAHLYFDGNLSTVANLFMWCCGLTPILSYMLFCYQDVIIEKILPWSDKNRR